MSDSTASVEGIEYHSDRHLPRSLIIELSSCGFIEQKRKVILLGPAGAGKTYIVCALGSSACRSDYSVRYIRLPELFHEIAESRLNGEYRSCLKKYQKVDLLILDE